MVRELYIDNQRVDLPDDVRFQLTFEIADFGELKPRGSGSNTIRLPKTPRNTAIFGNCNFVQVASAFPYVLHSAYYYEDGWLVFNDATVYMLAITDTDFEIQCVWGNAPEIKRLQALDMGDVEGLGNVNYDADAYGYIETGMKGVQGDVIPFPLATNRGLRSAYTRGLLSVQKALEKIPFTAEYSPSVQSYLNNLYAFPAMTKATVEYADEEFNGEIIQDLNNDRNDYTTLAQDPSNPDITTLSKNPQERRKAMIPIANTNRTITTQGGTPFDGVVAPFTLKGGWYDVAVELSGIMFQNPAKGTVGPETNVTSAVFVLGQVLAGDDVSKYTSESDSSIVINIDSLWDTTGKTYSGSKRIYIDDTGIDMGDGITAVPEVYCALWPRTGNPNGGIWANMAISAKVKITMTQLPRQAEVEINMPDETKAGVKNYITILMSDVLRGTSAYDFVTQALINAGALFDSKDGATRVYTYDDIANNGEGMIDWSDKLVYIKEESTFNQSGGSQNEIKYRQSDDYNGFGDGAFYDPLAQQLQKEVATAVENRTFGFNNGFFRLMQYIDFLFIPFVKETTEKDGSKSYEFKDRGWNLLRLDNRNLGYLTTESGAKVQPGYNARGADSVQPTFDNIKDTNWARYIAMRQQYRKAKALFMLNGRDIAELDFKRPIYLRQYAQSYILTKVDYQTNASTVEMLLVR